MMRSILNRLGLKKLVASVVAATVLVSGGIVLAQTGDAEEEAKQAETDGGATTQAISSQSLESRFVSVAPCRLVDTRQTSKLAADELRAFSAVGSDLSSQGGSGMGCGIPTRAGAISVNITAVNPDAKGFLRAGATCSYGILNPPCTNSVPNATVLNYSTALNASNGVDIPICSVWTSGVSDFTCNGGNFVTKAFTAATHIVVDVTGYYARPVFAIIDGDDTNGADPYPYPAAIRRTSGFTSAEHTSVGTYNFETIDDMRGCAFVATVGASDDSDAPRHDAYATVEHFGATTVEVTVTDDTGVVVNSEFTLVAFC